jgi:hypothetical protein
MRLPSAEQPTAIRKTKRILSQRRAACDTLQAFAFSSAPAVLSKCVRRLVVAMQVVAGLAALQVKF